MEEILIIDHVKNAIDLIDENVQETIIINIDQ